MSYKENDRVVRSAAKPIVDVGKLGDEASVGVKHGWVGTVKDQWVDSNNVQRYSVCWDGFPQDWFSYQDEYLEPVNAVSQGPRINGSFDLSKCCEKSCNQLNEYNNDVNCDDGWRCGGCRVLRSMQ